MSLAQRNNQLPKNAVWLEVQNVGLCTKSNTIEVQLRGDKDNRWWETTSKESAFKTLFDAMEKKRPIHACLTIDAAGKKLTVSEVAILFAESQR